MKIFTNVNKITLFILTRGPQVHDDGRPLIAIGHLSDSSYLTSVKKTIDIYLYKQFIYKCGKSDSDVSTNDKKSL